MCNLLSYFCIKVFNLATESIYGFCILTLRFGPEVLASNGTVCINRPMVCFFPGKHWRACDVTVVIATKLSCLEFVK
jgi:hypothetical protein